MIRPWDHFHADIELTDGSVVEVEGGWSSFPPNWENKTEVQRTIDILLLCEAWSGYNNIRKLVSFYLGT